MQIKTILNRIQKFKSFVYGAVRLVEGAPVPTLEVEIQPRSNSRPVCSGCGHKRPGYDRSPERLFEFIPMWGHKVFFVYAPRRVECPDCGIRVERMPWVSGKHRLTEAYTLCDLSARRVIPARRSPTLPVHTPCGGLRVAVFILTIDLDQPTLVTL